MSTYNVLNGPQRAALGILSRRFLWNINSYNWSCVYTFHHRGTGYPVTIIENYGDCGRRLMLRSIEDRTEYRGCARDGGISFTGDRNTRGIGELLEIDNEGMQPDCPECISRIAETQYLIYLHNGGVPLNAKFQ